MSEPPASVISPGNGMAFFFLLLLSYSRLSGPRDKHKTIWKRSRETLKMPDSQAVNKKERIHNVSREKFIG